MEVTGKLYKILQYQSGKSSFGEWVKQDFIIETGDFKKLCITNWNNRINLQQFNPGDGVKLTIEIESRPFKEKWFTNIKATNIETINQRVQQGISEKEEPAKKNSSKIDDKSEDPFTELDEKDLSF